MQLLRPTTLVAATMGLLCALGSLGAASAQHTANSASAHYYDGALAGVACQTPWIQSGTAGGFGGYVTAWHDTNSPTYNAKCGKCMQLTSTQSGKNAGKSIYVTVIDYKGAQGWDVSVPAWQTLFGTDALDVYSVSFQEVDACKCQGNKNCGSGGGGGTTASPCDKCNLPASQGGCKCDNNCNCVTAGISPCAKCDYCACDSACKCKNKCDLCNVPLSAGGCKCNQNCDCI